MATATKVLGEKLLAEKKEVVDKIAPLDERSSGFFKPEYRSLGQTLSLTYNVLYKILETGTTEEKLKAAEIVSKLR